MRSSSLAAVSLLATLFASACGGETCQSSCLRFYEEEQCDAPPAGLSRSDAIDQCIDICQDALQVPGEPVGDDRRFDPARTAGNTEDHVLDNEQEAAAWIDCVWSFTDDECPERLDDQYCIKIF